MTRNQVVNQPNQGKQYLEDFFVYEVDFTAGIAPGATANGTINVQADSDFKWIKSAYEADEAGASQEDSSRLIALCSVLITDTGSGRALMSSAVPIPNVFGTGQIPFIVPVPRIFKAKSSITVAVTNFDAAVTYRLRLSFIGTKLFEL
jgi:hypothetical protein